MRLWRFWAALCCGIFVSGSALAADLFAVDVLVDVTDVNASVAREKAMSGANRQALELILKKITTPQGVSDMMALNNNQILNFVKEVSVLSEKSSNVRYIAELRVKLNDAVVKKYMAEKQIPFVVDKGANVLVIPVYRDALGATAMLWEEGNLWYQAWEKNFGSKGMVDFVTLEANPKNFEAVDAAKALSLDARLMGWLARENRVSNVFVLEATQTSGGLNVKIFSPSGEGGVQESFSLSRAVDARLLDDAVEQVKNKISGRIKSQSVAEAQSQQEITVLFMYAKVKEWLDLQKQLQDIPYVKKVQEEAIGNGKTQFKLVFAGSVERLNNALAAKLFRLKDYGNFYVIESGY